MGMCSYHSCAFLLCPYLHIYWERIGKIKIPIQLDNFSIKSTFMKYESLYGKQFRWCDEVSLP